CWRGPPGGPLPRRRRTLAPSRPAGSPPARCLHRAATSSGPPPFCTRRPPRGACPSVAAAPPPSSIARAGLGVFFESSAHHPRRATTQISRSVPPRRQLVQQLPHPHVPNPALQQGCIIP